MISSFDHENEFLWRSQPDRLAKWIAHWQIWERLGDAPGDVVEIGVHKGSSLIRWLTFREMTGGYFSRRVVGFDTFGGFPESQCPDDDQFVRKFVGESGDSLGKEQLLGIIEAKGISENLQLVEGDVAETLPSWVAVNPDRRIALLHIDVDTYGPSKASLELLGEKVSTGGLIVLDDYGKFPGETRAWDEFNARGEWSLEKTKYHPNVCIAQRRSPVVKAPAQ